MSQKNNVLAIDFDNTIGNGLEARRRILSEGRRQFSITDAVNGSFKSLVSEDFYFHKMGELFRTDRFFALFEPFEGACETLQHLLSEGNKIKIVSTARGLTAERVRKWFSFHGLEITEVYVGQADKTRHYQTASIAIDDDEKHLQPHVRSESVTPILFRYVPVPPKNTQRTSGLITVHSWSELRTLLSVQQQSAAA